MDDHFKSLLVGEIRNQCNFACSAIESRDAAIRAFESPAERAQGNRSMTKEELRALDEVFRQTHSFLSHTSNVSRLFWPPLPIKKNKWDAADRRADLRAQTLRTLYSLDDQSPLANRKLRNHLEHFDSRLDDWWAEHGAGSVAIDNIGSIVMLQEIVPRSSVLRHFDPGSGLFYFRGEEFDLTPLANEADRVRYLSDLIARRLDAGRP